MSDERAHEFGDLDFGGVVVEEEEQFVVENEKIRRVEFVKEKESGSAENERETMLISSKSKRVKDISIDRLSALPDALLIHILSLVGYDVKEAAVTCVLSKRWQFLWSELPRLNFLDRTWDIEKVRDFVSWVHRTLLFRTGTYLEQFEVNFLYEECYAPDVNAWIRFAVKSKVKDLNLELHSPMYFYKLPQVLYFNSCLTSLHIQRCILAPQRIIEWQSLTGLNIKDVELDERVIQKILSGCPVLHWLTLSSCWGFKRLDVNSESVYQLRVADFEERNSEPLLEISAPYLRSLHTLFCPTGKKLQLTNVASLVSFSIHFTVLDDSVEVMSNTMELLQKTQHVKELRLEGAFVEVVSVLVMHDWQLPQSSKRDCLSLETSRDEDSIPGILSLLESSPNLKILLIECLVDSYEKSLRTWNPTARDDLHCDLMNLKTVRLYDYADPNLGGEPMLTMAGILLKRAPTLKKMVIDAYENLTRFPSDFNKMSQKVLGYPKSSEKAVFVFRQ